ncbi:ethionine resistance protein, partial [Coemansia sp. BCRC 34490]
MSPKSIASTKSLPYPRERDDPDAGSGMVLPPPLTSAAPQDRRRSVAYERYPPLVSMFEPHRTVSGESFACSPEFRHATTVSEVSSPSSFASGLRTHDMATASFSPHSSWLQQHQPAEARSPDQESVRAVSGHAEWVHGDSFCRQSVPQQPQHQHQHQHQHQMLRPFEPSRGSSRSSSSSSNASRHSPQAASLSLATNQIGSTGSGSITTITTRTGSSISNGGEYQQEGGNNINNGSTQPPPSLRRNPNSSTSLASTSSSSSSSSLLSSISSAPSTYAYIFDSARSPLLSPSQAALEDDLLAQKHGKRFRSRSNTVSSDPFRTPAAAAAASADIARRKSAQNLLLAIADGSGFDSVMPATAVGHSAAAIPAHHEDVAEVRRYSSYQALQAAPDERMALVGAAASLVGPDESLATPALARREGRKVLGAAGYLLVGNALQAVISMSQVASSGHLGGSELAAIGLAHMVVILTGYPVAFSVLSCLETCASQAFMSAQPVLVGAYFVQAVQILWIFGLVLGSLWFSAQPLLAYIMRSGGSGSAETISMAATYLRWYFVPFMGFSTMLCARQVLYAQGITYPLPYLTLLGAVVTVGAQYLLVFSPYMQLGVRGIAVGSGAGYFAMLLATLLIIRKHNVAHVWGGLRVRAPWRPFIRLLPACVLLSLLSTGTSELITVAATQLGAASLTAQSVLSALSRMYMIAFSSIGVAALNRSGNLIGQQAARGARVSAHVSLCIGVACVVAGCAAVLLAPAFWIRIFTADAKVVADIEAVVPVAVVAFAAQSLAFVGSQLLSAQGRQALAARIKFAALYVVAVPLGYYWAMVCGRGLWGLWAAVAVGQTCTAVVEIIVVLRTNWSRLVRY